jgi:hypothetical protein
LLQFTAWAAAALILAVSVKLLLNLI